MNVQTIENFSEIRGTTYPEKPWLSTTFCRKSKVLLSPFCNRQDGVGAQAFVESRFEIIQLAPLNKLAIDAVSDCHCNGGTGRVSFDRLP